MTKIEKAEKIAKKSDNNLKLYLAPMAGYTDLPFRLLVQENGADITTSEMISAKGIFYKDKKTKKLLETVPEERNFGIQLFGSEPLILNKVVNELEEKRANGEIDYSFIDFNVGCPAPKIVKNGDGSALLKNPKLLNKNIKSIKEASKVPVSVKTRIGFNENRGLELASIIQESGADRIVIHPRTREQFYSGHSDWETAKEILDKLDIPVVLSGDIISPQKAKEAIDLGFNELMIGREAVNNPTIFTQIKDYIKTGSYRELSNQGKIDIALKHIDLARKFDNSNHTIIALRKQLASYIKGLKDASQLRNQIFKIKDAQSMINLLEQIREEI